MATARSPHKLMLLTRFDIATMPDVAACLPTMM